MNSVWLSAAALRKMITSVSPDSYGVERRVDEILGLALGAFNMESITELDFREISSKCLDMLPSLAR